MSSENSGDLLRRSHAGDETARLLLVQRHWASLRAFARARMSPQLRAVESGSDLVQEVVLRLLQDPDGLEYRDEESFRAWLFTAVHNQLRNHERDLRAQKRDVRRNLALPPETAALSVADCYASALSPSRAAIADEEVRALESALDQLPEHYREVIALSRFARLSRTEVARRMGRSEDSVRNLLHRALASLAETMERTVAGD